MKYEEKLENVSVIGAAGKMGSGILLLTAMEMVNQKLKAGSKNRDFVLYAYDTNQKGLIGLLKYIRSQAVKMAEKQIVRLRKAYASSDELIDNEEIINQYALDVLNVIRPVTNIEATFDSRIIFEAVSEKPALKIELLSQIKQHNKSNPWFFTNTSSIPIHYLDQEAALDGYIMGVHFYNPPAVQRLVEIAKAETTRPELTYFVSDFLKNIGKTPVPSHDVAGFIGNGYLMRDISYASSVTDELMKNYSNSESLFMINTVSQDFLIRPMGIFQLVDYVGIDVVQYIMEVMQPHLKNERLQSRLVDYMLDLGIKGGQNTDGSQKDGFFSYSQGKPAGIFDQGKKRYVPIEEVSAISREYLGGLPKSFLPWKMMKNEPAREQLLEMYFNELKTTPGMGAEMARSYLEQFKQIGTNLVKYKIAFKYDDVNTVLELGFHHLYGPVSKYF